MPIIKSAQKRMRQERVRHERNLVTKQNVKNASKAFDAAVATKDSKKIISAQNDLNSALDTATKKNIIHKNKAARKKSTAAAEAKKAGAKPVKSTAKKPAAKPVAKKAPAKKAATKKSASKK